MKVGEAETATETATETEAAGEGEAEAVADDPLRCLAIGMCLSLR